MMVMMAMMLLLLVTIKIIIQPHYHNYQRTKGAQAPNTNRRAGEGGGVVGRSEKKAACGMRTLTFFIALATVARTMFKKY